MKHIIPILLLAAISISHLNIIDTLMYLSGKKFPNAALRSRVPISKDTQKQTQVEEEKEEQHKHFSHHHSLPIPAIHIVSNIRQLGYHNLRYQQPYQDDYIQPPNAVNFI